MVRRSPVTRWRTPPSDSVCDVIVLAFALWTISAHATVAIGGGLAILCLAYVPVLGIGLTLWTKFCPTTASMTPVSGVPDSSASSARGLRGWVLRSAAVAVGLAVALGLSRMPDSRFLWWTAVLLLGVAAVMILRTEQHEIEPAVSFWSSEILLWVLGAACVVLALVSHRPDADDAFYVNMAVAAADAPGRALLSGDTLHGVPGMPLYVPVYRVHSYELLNGAVTYLTGWPAIYVFHWLAAGFWALLVPLAYARLFRLLTPRWWLVSVVVVLVVLVSVGETHRWYGNFAFVRMWQGKALLLSIFLPLIYAYGLRFMARPNPRDWVLLCAAQIAAVGCSATALWVAPSVALSALLCGVRLTREGLSTMMVGALASSYVVGVAWLTKLSLGGRFGGMFDGIRGAYDLRGGEPWSSMHYALVIALGDSRLLAFGVASILASWALAPPGIARRFAVICPLAVILLVLNPYIAGWMSVNVLGPSHWRAMWSLPVPTLMTLVLTSPLHLGRAAFPRKMAVVILLAGFVLLIPRYGGLSQENSVQLTWPQLKVPQPAYRWAETVNKSVPPGSTIAVPSEIDPWIGTFAHHSYPLIVRNYLRADFIGFYNTGLRLQMRGFLDDPALVEANPAQFRADLDDFAIRGVCLTVSPRADMARAILQQAGFHRTIAAADYEIWVRPGT